MSNDENKTEDDHIKQSLEFLKGELDKYQLENFLAAVDKVWYDTIINYYKAFHRILDELI